MSTPKSLAGTVVAITGAGRGIGAATAKALHAAGARVAIGDLDLATAEATAKALGDDVPAILLDVTDNDSVLAFIDDVEARLGPIEVYINNAGIMPLARLLDDTDEITAKVLDINVRAMIFGTREIVRRMQPRGKGHVINVASTAGKAGVPGASTYCASKHAMVGFSESVAAELRGTGIEVSCVMPGITRTDLASGVGDMPGFRSITPEQVAEGIVDAIRSPRFEVFVPRSAKGLFTMTALLPRAVATGIARKMGTDRIFLDAIDGHERGAYEARVR